MKQSHILTCGEIAGFLYFFNGCSAYALHDALPILGAHSRERAIRQGVFLMKFLTVFLTFLELGTLFLSLGVAILV